MLSWRNSRYHYGLMAVLCHWLTALAVVALFILGLWMTGLNYYNPWYQAGPDIHRSIGVLLALLVTWRLVWRALNPQPKAMVSHSRWESAAAKVTHLTLYLLLFGMFISGYLITTAEGQALAVFDWFSIPATLTNSSTQMADLEDRAGDIHELLAFGLIGLASVHALAALKHHFIDKDATLLRMLGKPPKANTVRGALEE